MKTVAKICAVAAVAFITWFLVAPDIWPSHPLILTLLVAAVAAVGVAMIWPGEVFPRS